MQVTMVRGRWYENILIQKFNGQKFFDTKISRITVVNELCSIKTSCKFIALFQGSQKFFFFALYTRRDERGERDGRG